MREKSPSESGPDGAPEGGRYPLVVGAGIKKRSAASHMAMLPGSCDIDVYSGGVPNREQRVAWEDSDRED